MTSVTRGLLALLVAALVVVSPDAAEARSVGHTSAPDGTLRSGCHNYRYHYVIKTPTNDWTLETFLKDPDGQGLASGTFFADSDPRRNATHFRFCRYSTRAGRFTIKAKVHWYGTYGHDHQAWLEPSHFRLRRP